MSEPQAAVNWQHALESVDGDERLLQELAQAFLLEAPTTLEEIRQGIEEHWRAARTLKISAHRLKGALWYFGAPTATEMTEHLESLGEQATNSLGDAKHPEKGPYQARAKLTELEQQVARIRECLIERFGAATVEPSKK
jgi:HPt (histidine-containing phosphotransfer) domain-containing protein